MNKEKEVLKRIWDNVKLERVEDKDIKSAFDCSIDIESYIREVTRLYREKQNERIIDDIMRIRRGRYINYDVYVNEKLKEREKHQEEPRFEANYNLVRFNMYVVAEVLDEKTFDYIVSQYGDKE